MFKHDVVVEILKEFQDLDASQFDWVVLNDEKKNVITFPLSISV